jgi:hypothetical protein
MKKIIISIILLCAFAVSCTTKPEINSALDNQPAVDNEKTTPGESAYPMLNSADENDPYPPAPTETSGDIQEDIYTTPSESAFTALVVAEKFANTWKEGARLTRIPRLRQTEANLAIPTGPSGWFFIFKEPNEDSLVELYLEVIDGKVVGYHEVQILYGGKKPTYIYLPIDLSQKLLDSTDVFEIYLKNDNGSYKNGRGVVELDFQLVQLEGMATPVWSIFDTAFPEAPPIMNLDAVSGEKVPDPLN